MTVNNKLTKQLIKLNEQLDAKDYEIQARDQEIRRLKSNDDNLLEISNLKDQLQQAYKLSSRRHRLVASRDETIRGLRSKLRSTNTELKNAREYSELLLDQLQAMQAKIDEMTERWPWMPQETEPAEPDQGTTPCSS